MSYEDGQNSFTITNRFDYPQWFEDRLFDPFLRGFIAQQNRKANTRMKPSVVVHLKSYAWWKHPKSGRTFEGKVWCREMTSHPDQSFILFFELESDATIFTMTLNDV